MFRLRSIQPDDVPAIFDLIGQLADFEQLRAQMVGNIADLQRHLFGEPRFAHAVIAEADGKAVGFALYFFNYSTFQCRPGLYLEDLFVRPEYRAQGIGHALLVELEARARAQGCGRFEWAVLDWNQSAIDFYRRFGAEPKDGWIIYRKTLIADNSEQP